MARKIKAPKKAFLLFLFLKISLLQAQQSAVDFGAWASVAYKQDLTKDFTFKIEQEFRTKNNASLLYSYFTQAKLSYEVFDNFDVAFNYRFIRRYRKEGFFSNRNRFMLDIKYAVDLQRFRLSYRQRLEREIHNYGEIEEAFPVPAWDSRNTFQVKYYLNQRISPYLSADFRYLFHDPNDPEYQQWDRFRLKAGFDYKMNRQHEVGFYFRYQRHYIEENRQFYIVGVEYNFEGAGKLFGN